MPAEKPTQRQRIINAAQSIGGRVTVDRVGSLLSMCGDRPRRSLIAKTLREMEADKRDDGREAGEE